MSHDLGYAPRFDDALTNTDAAKAASVVASHRASLVGQSVRDWMACKYESGPQPDEWVEAANRLRSALSSGDRIGVWGDYDADGAGSAIIVKECIEAAGGDTYCQLANRSDGYGFRPAHAERAHEAGCKLLVVCDAGTNDIDGVADARKLGLEVIVIDHHQPTRGAVAPATHLLNPYVAEDAAGHQCLCSAGLAIDWLSGNGFDPTSEHYALASISSIADMVDMVPINRSIVSRGLEALATTKRPGLHALLRLKGVKDRAPTSTDIGFGIAPAINAPGRIGDTLTLLQLLVSKDYDTAEAAAKAVNKLNEQRKADQREALAKARSVALIGNHCIVTGGQEWSPGIAGPIAGNLSREYNKPAWVLTRSEDGRRRGSCRAPAGYSAHDAMTYAQEQLGRKVVIRCGGHHAAGGVTLATGHERDFARVIDEYFESVGAVPESNTVLVDGFLQLSNITIPVCESIETLGPYSPDFGCNPEPVWLHRNAQIRSVSTLGKTGEHSQIDVVGMYDGFEQAVRVVAFFKPAAALGVGVGDRADIAYTASVTHWRGRPEAQLKLVDLWRL